MFYCYSFKKKNQLWTQVSWASTSFNPLNGNV